MATIAERLAFQARTRAASVAVVSDHGELSWEELADLALRMSALLRARGVARGDRVALLCGNRAAFLVAWLGVANLGAIAVSLNTGLVGEGLRYCVTQCGARMLVAERALAQAKRSDLQAALADCQLLDFDGEDDLYDVLARHEPDPVYDGAGSDPVSIIYTSGTTGLPKGVLNCHEAFLASGRLMSRSLAISAEDRIMVFLPLFHANPQMYAVMSALESGCAIVLRPKFSVSQFFADARRFGCTLFTYVGTALSMLTSRLRQPCLDHPLTRCVGGGCPADVWRAMQERFGIRPYELYGMTEVGGWVTGNSVDDYRFGSCGRARPDMEVCVVDADDMPLPAGEAGEIVVRPRKPHTLLLGYWRNPQASWEASRNFWFHTGDLGAMDADGYLYFRGRLKEIIRRAGENISPFEIETALLDHPDVADAAVVAVPDPIYGEEIKAVVVARRACQPAALRAFLKGRIADFMLPRYVQFVDEIPRTETQKILRHALQRDNGGMIDVQEREGHA